MSMHTISKAGASRLVYDLAAIDPENDIDIKLQGKKNGAAKGKCATQPGIGQIVPYEKLHQEHLGAT